jgi:hypothetical protein
MGEAWYDSDPYFVCSDRQMWVGCDEEVVEQTHVESRLHWSDLARIDRLPESYSRTCLA